MKTAKPLPHWKHLGFGAFCLSPQHCVYFTHMCTHIPRYNSREIERQANRPGQGVKESIRIAKLIETELTKGESLLCTQVSKVQVYQTDGVNPKAQLASLKVLSHIGSSNKHCAKYTKGCLFKAHTRIGLDSPANSSPSSRAESASFSYQNCCGHQLMPNALN